MIMRTSPTRCPNCGEHVSPFAAGCALCGADLDPDRTRHVPISRRLGSAWDAFSQRPDLIATGVVILAAAAYLTAGRL